jgi:hypothetical protein
MITKNAVSVLYHSVTRLETYRAVTMELTDEFKENENVVYL